MSGHNDFEIAAQDFNQRYRLIRRVKDPFGRDFNIVKDMRTQRRAIIKAYLVDSQYQLYAIITNLNNYIYLRQVDGLCRIISFTRLQTEIQAAFEFDDVTLYEFLKAKQLSASSFEDICACLLNQVVETLSILQYIGMEIDDLRPANILIESEGDKNTFKIFYDEREKFPPKNLAGLCLSPERLIELRDNRPDTFNSEAKIVFECGLLILMCATDAIKDSNYRQDYSINEQVIQNRLELFKKCHGNKFLLNAILSMLQPMEQRIKINDLKMQCYKELGNRTSFLMSRISIPEDDRSLQKSSTVIQLEQSGRTDDIRKAHPEVLYAFNNLKESLKRVKVEVRSYQDGSTYEGEMKNNTREGIGIYSYSHGDVYFGEWRDNALINGTYMFKNGESYQGSVRNGKHGLGKYRYLNGNIYEGMWENDLKHGKGTMVYPNGDRYDGNWEKGKKNGYGVYYYNNGIVYEGNYVDGKKSGFGAILFPDKTKFYGAWQESNAEGFGKILYRNGDVFEGEFRDSYKNGNGMYRWHDSTVYKGDLREDTLSGKCRIEYDNGELYEGTIVNGYKEGYGTYYYANKDVFIGAWKADSKHMGRYTYADGSYFEGYFKDNNMSFGTMTYLNGDCYEGEFRGNQRHGFGKYQFDDGTSFSGEWLHDGYIVSRSRY